MFFVERGAVKLLDGSGGLLGGGVLDECETEEEPLALDTFSRVTDGDAYP